MYSPLDTPVLQPKIETNREVLTRLLRHYGDGADGMSPTRAQWSRLLAGAQDGPVTLINFFELREVASVGPGSQNPDTDASGADAMMRYAAVSGPALERVGGSFLLMAPFESSLMGEDENWDLVAIGKYPSRSALFSLFEDAEYVTAYAHRRAALRRQRVWVVAG